MSFDGLVGRREEVSRLANAVGSARTGGSVLLIVGEPGIGKSALLAAAKEEGRNLEFAVFEALGVQGEMHLPFGAIQQLLSPLLSRLGSLAPSQRDAIETAFGLAEGTPPDLFLVAQAAISLFELQRAAGPVIIAVDDLQWLDPQSHQILTFLGHRAIAANLLVLATVRTSHRGPFADSGFDELQVSGIDDQTAETLLRTHAPGLTEAAFTRIRAESEGNPLALLELPRAWVEGPPADSRPAPLTVRLERAFGGRVSELPPATRDALLVAAIESSGEIQEIRAALAAFDAAASSADVFEPAIAAGLIRDAATTLQFRHPLVRSGILQSEPLIRQHAAHAAVADVLTDDTYRRAWHRAWSIVGPDDEIADELDDTVVDSLRRGAAMTAVSCLERAAQLTSTPVTRGERLVRAAQVAFGAGRPDVVARLVDEVALVDLTDLDQARVTWLGEVLNGDVSSNPAAIRRLCDAADRAHQLGDEGLALNLLMSAGLRCWWAESCDDGRARVIRMLDSFAELRSDPRHIAAIALTEPVQRGAEVSSALQDIDVADVDDGEVLRTYGMTAYAIGDLPLATDLLDRAEQQFRSQGRLGLLPVVLALQLHIRLELGDWAGAAAASAEVYSVSVETGQAVYADNNVFVEARARALRGEWRTALEQIEAPERDATRLRINDRVCLAYQARGTALISAVRAEEAFLCLARQFDPDDVGYHLRESFSSVALLAETALDCGRLAEARDILDSMQATAIVTPSPLLEVNLRYARAALAPHAQRGDQYRDALDHDLSRWPWIRARLHLEYGRWLLSIDDSVHARSQLAAGQEIFERIGATPWIQRTMSAIEAIPGGSEAQP